MTEEMREKLEALRASAKRLNTAANQATRLVEQVERFLTETVSIGISAQAGPIHTEIETTDDGESADRNYYLAYGRLPGDRFRIQVIAQLQRTDRAGDWEVLEEERILWSSCPRQLKLLAFQRLPDLLDTLCQNATKLADDADEAERKIGDLMAALGSDADPASDRIARLRQARVEEDE
jgi:hypothetical protein